MGSTSPPSANAVVESCLLCNVKVRIQADKVLVARCPRCRGPLGDPKMEQACRGCGAVNRVFRSRLSAARCGKCKAALLEPSELTRDLILADLYAAVGAIFADGRLAGRRVRPRDLVEAVELMLEMPQAITELTANMAPSDDRTTLAALAGRCKSLPPKVRPIAFDSTDVLADSATVERYMLADAFLVMQAHPSGFAFLARARRTDPGPTSAREELACARQPFERILDKLHVGEWGDVRAEQNRRDLGERVFTELAKVLEVWLPRPYKLYAMVKSALSRLADLPEGEALAANEAVVKESVAVFLARSS